MINLKKIEEAKERLVTEFNPEKIYIFGSYAWGNPTEDSDLDIMIVVKKLNNKLLEMRRGIKSLRGIGFPKDIIVESEDEFLKNSKDLYKIENEIYNRGYLIYENTN
jgi:predicted nucleotidyltransferase